MLPGSCILWIYNPVAYPVIKQISLFRITNPHSTEGGMTYPADHAATFAHLTSTSAWMGGLSAVNA